MKNADMPAMPVIDEEQSFPVDMERYGSKEATLRFAFGMTKREMMAMHIISGIAYHPDMMQANADGAHDSVGQAIAAQSVLLADYLLAELERTK